MFRKILSKYTTFDLIVISLLAACGIAVKPYVRLLSQAAIGTIIPAGTIAGIIYMLWIVLACNITKKRGTAILVGIIQSFLVLVFDMLGNRGVANLLVYILPGITLELFMLMSPKYVTTRITSFFAGAIANITGGLIVGTLFLRLPFEPLAISAATAFVSGGFGGVIGYSLYNVLTLFNNKNGKNDID